MKERMSERKMCPMCHREYTERPAISRVDGITPICPDCGTRQALGSLGVSIEEQEKILGSIHRSMGENNMPEDCKVENAMVPYK